MADKTALAESSQALFCSIADNLGSTDNKTLDLKTFPTYIDFKCKNVEISRRIF
jgi:hypothetical protein